MHCCVVSPSVLLKVGLSVYRHSPTAVLPKKSKRQREETTERRHSKPQALPNLGAYLGVLSLSKQR